MNIFSHFIEVVSNYISSGGYIVGFLIIVLESFIPPLPLGFFVMLNCISFGLLKGYIISYTANVSGSILAYFIWKKFKTFLYKRIPNKYKLKVDKLLLKFNKLSFSSLVLLITLPFTPAFLINICAGISLKFKRYVCALVIGKIFNILFWSIIGNSLYESIHDIKSILFILISLLISYIISKIVASKYEID